MKRIFFDRLLILVVVISLPMVASAQDDTMSFTEDEVESDSVENDEEMSFDADEMEEVDEGEAEGESVSQSDILSVLDEEEEADQAIQIGKEGEEAVYEELERHPIWALQRIYALKAGRVDLQPSFGVSLNDPYVQHMSFSVAASYYLTEILAVGVSFNFYGGMNAISDLNFQTSRATHQIVPINEYLWGGQVNFSYIPMYGKFALFKKWILHWDVWLIGGGGFIFTKPFPQIDPDYRDFDYTMKFCFNVGIGGRLFLSKFLAVYIELRDYIFPEQLESRIIDSDDRSNRDAWIDDDLKLTNNVVLNFGVSLFIPFTFDYKLPK
ncbi:MAG: outer membrane beta-barrel domain-containing protein [Proteobacteria bacterium]|nr:outer membrane beta-barrel domain-containing protein [Pseudomonadota bacterium]